MIPAGYTIVPTRALLYQHCAKSDPILIRNHGAPIKFAVQCTECGALVGGVPTDLQAVSDWNDHCIARLSSGKGH
jgi:hypothetical protein